MVSVTTASWPDKAGTDFGPIRCPTDRRAKTRSAAQKALRIADWLAAQAGSNQPAEQDGPDEHELFAALHACAYRATRGARGKTVTQAERAQWAERWRTIRNYLIARNLGLAYKMVARFRTSQVDRDDLRSEAFLALLRAVERFDPWRGFRLSTYACHAILKTMMQAVRRSKRYGLQLVDEPELASEPDSQGNRWTELRVDRLRCALHLNQGDLTERESTVLAGRFPMGGGSQRTLSQIGDTLGLSKERVRQIQNVALAKLRDVLQADPLLQ